MLARTLSAAALLALTSGALAQVTFQPIALTGHADALGPGEPGLEFSSLSGSGHINSNGDVVFIAADNHPTPLQGVWLHTSTGNTPIAKATWTIGPYQYGTSQFNFPIINNAGQRAWRYGTALLVGDSGAGALPTAALDTYTSGFIAPGTGDATYHTFTFPAPLLASNGQNAFVAQLSVGSGDPVVTFTPSDQMNAYGLWSGAPDNLQLRLRQNDLYPGTTAADNLRIGSLPSTNPYISINGSGQILTAVSLQGNVITTNGSGNNGALLKYTPGSGGGGGGSWAVVARKGDPVADSPGEFLNGIAGTSVPSINSDMNDAGQVVFLSSLRNAASGGTQTTGWALFSNVSGTLSMLARGTSPMPAIARANGSEFVGVSWGSFGDYSLINHSGTILFNHNGMTGPGMTNGVNTSAIFTYSNGTFTKVMRQGDPAPALSTTGGVSRFNGLQGIPAFNALGQVVFRTLLTSSDGGINPNNNLAMFAVDAQGAIYLLAQKGTGFQVAPGDIRVVSSLGGVSGSGNEDGRPSGLSDTGRVVFSLDFNDGSSGVFVATIPGSPTLCPGGCGSQDYNGDGDYGTDQDIEAFFACLGGNCCPTCFCGGSDFNGDGDYGTDQDIEAFFRVLGGGNC